MRKLLHTILELEEWNKNSTCCFCFNKSVCQIRYQSKTTHKIIANNEACESCKEKFENDELKKCERCGRFRNMHSSLCRCISNNENLEEKELPVLPQERRMDAFYERQINSLQGEKQQLTEEVETHLEALEISKDWHKRQKQELLDRIKELEAEIERLKKLTPQELVDKVTAYEKEISEWKVQLTKLQQQNSQLMAQIEVKETKKWPWLKVKR